MLEASHRQTYVLDDHNQEGQLNAENLLGVNRGIDEVSADVSSHDFEDRRLNIGVSYPFDVSVSHFFVPDLEGLGSIANKK